MVTKSPQRLGIERSPDQQDVWIAPTKTSPRLNLWFLQMKGIFTGVPSLTSGRRDMSGGWESAHKYGTFDLEKDRRRC